MGSKGRLYLVLGIGVSVLIIGLVAWLRLVVYESEKPEVKLEPLPEYFAAGTKFNLAVNDMKRGLRRLRVTLIQEGRETLVLEEKFPADGLLKKGKMHTFDGEVSFEPSKLKVSQGEAVLQVQVWDYSKKNSGEGNLTILEHKMQVDTIPPDIQAISRLNYINVGGSGLVVYQTSADTESSGVYVGSLFFQGFPVEQESGQNFYACYFAIPCNVEGDPEIFLWAQDKAGNQSKTGFNHRVRKKNFPTVRANVSDGFLKTVLPYFSDYPFSPGSSDVEKYLKINRDLRKENTSTYYNYRNKTAPRQLWEGTWLRQENAATMAKFGVRRHYYYNNEKIDEQIHMGIDLASLANTEIQATNNGRVIHAGRLGIYGLTVVLDHGQGLASVYSHLSKVSVQPEQTVKKGDTVGLSGRTGLASGDHLHFAIMVGGVFVNPIEWWDPHWIKDNVTRKLELLKEYG